MIENENASLKLKSEVILLKNQIDQTDDTTSKQLHEMRSRVEKEQEKANGQKISQLTENTEKLTRENDLQKTRIQ